MAIMIKVGYISNRLVSLLWETAERSLRLFAEKVAPVLGTSPVA